MTQYGFLRVKITLDSPMPDLNRRSRQILSNIVVVGAVLPPSLAPPVRVHRISMRPLSLDVEGFTCYRERQKPLDFSSLLLFAIAGPTSAGKPSILDAMVYALYGEVSRIGKQGIGEVISHGCDAMSVTLDFRVNGKD